MSFVHRVYGAAGAMVFLAGAGAYHAMDIAANWKPANAEVSYIDRNCKIIRTQGHESETITDACNSIDEWNEVRTKRNMDVDGKAVVHLTYTAPQNGQSETAELTFDGHDDEFYELKAGDQMQILVSNSDPTTMRKA